MRIDRLLCLLRFVRTRSAAHKLVEEGHIRRNGERIIRASRDIAEGDVLTLPLGNSIHLIEIISLPERRGPPREAEACYRKLDPSGQNGNSSANTTARQGKIAP